MKIHVSVDLIEAAKGRADEKQRTAYPSNNDFDALLELEAMEDKKDYQLDSIGIEFHNDFSSPILTFFVIFILKLTVEYSNKR